MNKFLTLMMVALVTLFAVNSFALDTPASPAPFSWISDTSGVLSPAAHQRLDDKLKVINQSSANEVAALIVPTLNGSDISDVANATFKAWGVGKKNLDNGVLVVLAMKEHKSRIETGKGVEGDLPDLKTQDILNNVVRPYMRKGDVEGALSNTFDAVASSIANHRAEVAARGAAGTAATSTQAPTTSTSSQPSCSVSAVGANDGGGSFWTILLLLLGGGGGLWWFISRSRSRQAERDAELAAQTERLRREQAARTREARERRERQAAFSLPTPAVHVPTVTRPVASVPPPVPRVPAMSRPVAPPMPVTSVVPVVAAVAVAAELEREREEQAARNRRAEEARRERDEEDARRRRREREEEDDRRRRRDEESSSSSSSSGSSWGGGSDSGGSGGFGGGDSGGGGSSSDW